MRRRGTVPYRRVRADVVFSGCGTWATNWMKPPGADLLALMREGGWKRLQMVERYSHAIPVKDRSALPNPMAEAKIVSFSREAKVV